MDVDAFLAAHQAEWTRLDQLAHRRRLDGAEADELVALYRRVATHLAVMQSRAPDPVLMMRLSALLMRARAATAGTPRRSGWAALGHGVTVTLPAALLSTWRWWVGMMTANLTIAGAMMIWLRDHPERLTRLVSDARVRALVNHQFRDYYTASPARSFAAHVWTNNVLVTAEALFLGVTVLGVVVVMAANSINLGLVGGALAGAGRSNEFFSLVLPHGILELTAVFIAGGVGLRTGWAWIAPGALPRGRSLLAAGRTAGVVTLGLIPVLLVSGLIEAFVTPSALPTPARVGIGAVCETAFLVYVVVLGRRALRGAGVDEVLAEGAGAELPVG